jgi:hypothetical protein
MVKFRVEVIFRIIVRARSSLGIGFGSGLVLGSDTGLVLGLGFV